MTEERTDTTEEGTAPPPMMMLALDQLVLVNGGSYFTTKREVLPYLFASYQDYLDATQPLRLRL